jgi:hypothetical protein
MWMVRVPVVCRHFQQAFLVRDVCGAGHLQQVPCPCGRLVAWFGHGFDEAYSQSRSEFLKNTDIVGVSE